MVIVSLPFQPFHSRANGAGGGKDVRYSLRILVGGSSRKKSVENTPIYHADNRASS